MVSLCITTFNRTELLFDSFRAAIQDDRISEIVIVDDCSPPDVYQTLVWYCKGIDKVKLYRNDINIDCYKNKQRAVSLAKNDWVILFDSDNIISRGYVDRVFDCKWSARQILQPSAATPHFDFTPFAGTIYASNNIARFIEPTFCTMLNAMNYFVNRDEYLRVWDGSIDPVTSDSLYQNYRWLDAGNSIYVVPGLEYEHRIHDGSHYRQNVRRTPLGFHDSIVEKLKALQ